MAEDTNTAGPQGSANDVTKQESKALTGSGGPGRIPAFGKQAGQDENINLEDETQLASLKEGAEAQSGGPDVEARQKIDSAIAADGFSDEAPEDDKNVQYTSRIAALRIGKFQFERGVLSVTKEDSEKFEKILEGSSIRTQTAIRKIERGEGVVANPIKFGSRSNRGIDTSNNGPRSPQPSA